MPSRSMLSLFLAALPMAAQASPACSDTLLGLSDTLTVGEHTTWMGTVRRSDLPLPACALPALPSFPAPDGTQFVVTWGGTGRLDTCFHGSVMVHSGGTLLVPPGAYRIGAFTVEWGSAVKVDTTGRSGDTARAGVQLVVEGDVQWMDGFGNTYPGLSDSAAAARFNVFVAGCQAVTVGNGCSLRMRLVAPQGAVVLGDRTAVWGGVLARNANWHSDAWGKLVLSRYKAGWDTATVVTILGPRRFWTNATSVPVSWTVDGTAQTTQTTEALPTEGPHWIKRSAAGSGDSVLAMVDRTAPVVQILSPIEGLVTNKTIQPVTWSLDGVSRTDTSILVEGANALNRSFTDSAGNSGSATVHVTRDTHIPVVVIQSPTDGLVTNVASQTVRWTVDGVAQPATTITLVEGTDAIAKSYTSPAGNTGIATIHVTLDTHPPVVQFLSPMDGATVYTGTVTVRWSVDGVEQTPYTQTLAAGSNTLAKTAVDAAGNVGSATIHVTYLAAPPAGDTVPASPAPAAFDPTVITPLARGMSFLWSGSDPLQRGVLASVFDSSRLVVLRGVVNDVNGNPVAGVRVRVLHHPEFGYTFTRADGNYDLAANALGNTILDFTGTGYLPCQRSMRVLETGYANFTEVVLVRLDPTSTLVRTDGTSLAIQVAQGSVRTDSSGTRRETILLPAGVHAQLQDSAGNLTEASDLTLRATEYTVGPAGPKAMPADLPTGIGYTYAVELSSDEGLAADHVQFDQPVVLYNENFLHFPVGSPVPVGAYDRRQGKWIPQPSGRIIQILSVQGGAAAVDVDGDGIADTGAVLADLGITSQELARLGSLYPAGQTLWRVATSHFSIIDLNWGMEPPPDATDPDQVPPDDEDDEDCEHCSGSIVEPENQVLQESVPLPGTGMRLDWSSNRTPEAHRTLHIPVSGPVVPASLVRIELVVDVAGRSFSSTFLPAPNQTTTFTWDGRDAYGRNVQGVVDASIQVGYVYKAIYTRSPSFGNTTGMGIAGDVGRAEFTYWKNFTRTVGSFDAAALGIGGWSLDQVHVVDPATQTVYLGDGDLQVANPAGWQTVATSPPATTIQSIDFAQNGGIWVVEQTGPDWSVDEKLLRLDRSGNVLDSHFIVHRPDVEASWRTNQVSSCGDGTVAVSDFAGVYRLGRDGNLALVASGVSPTSVACAADGTIFFASGYAGGSVTKIAADSSRQTTILPGGSGAMGLDIGPDGLLYLADWNGGRILRLNADQSTTTILSGAIKPIGVSFTRDGKMLIPQYHPSMVLLADSTGILDTLYSVDEGAGYWLAQTIQATDGAIYVSYNGGIVRKDLSLLLRSLNGHIWAPSRDASRIWTFDAAGRHLATQDATTGRTQLTFGYDAQGRVQSWTDATGRTTRLLRNGNSISIVAPDGRTHVLSLDAQGRLASVLGSGRFAPWNFGYQGTLLTSFQEPDGAQHSMTYNDQAKLLKDQDARGGWQTLSTSDAGRTRTVVRATAGGTTSRIVMTRSDNGSESRTYINTDGTSTLETIAADQSTFATNPDGTIRHHVLKPDPRWGLASWDLYEDTTRLPSGLVQVRRHARGVELVDTANPLIAARTHDTFEINGQRTTVDYDRTSGTVVTTDPLGRQTTTILDGSFRPVQTVSPGRVPATYAWDSRDRLISTTQGGRAASYTWNDTDELTQSVDPLGATARFQYDPIGRTTIQTLADGRTILFGYDAGDRVTSLTPPGRSKHGWAYDPGGLDTLSWAPKIDSGDSTPILSRFDLDKRPTWIRLPSGDSLHATYDAAGRLVSMASKGDTIRYSYDAKVRLAGISRGGQSVSYGYDGKMPLSQTSTGTVIGVVSNTLDANLRPASQTVAGSTIAYGYDADGFPSQVGALSLSRDAASGLYSGDALGAFTHRVGRNGHGEMVADTFSNGSSILSLAAFTRDSLGRILTKLDSANGVKTNWRYHYDLAGRLDSVWQNGALNAWYGYDANGVRISGTSITGVNVDAQDRVTAANGATYAYNDLGQLVSRSNASGTSRYHYDLGGSLLSVRLPNGDSVAYTLDPTGRRIARSLNGAVSNRWLWDGSLRPIAEVDAAGNILTRYVYATHTNVPDYMVRGGATYRLVTDALGSVREVVDASTGAVVSSLSYDAWGRLTGSSSANFQPFGFAGGLRDDATGLTQFGAREYMPELGRWTEKDPIGFNGGLTNLYGYVGNDPVNRGDENGRLTIFGGYGGGGAMGAGGAVGGAGAYWNPTAGGGGYVYGGDAEGGFLSAGWSGGFTFGSVCDFSGPFTNIHLVIPDFIQIDILFTPDGSVMGFDAGGASGAGLGISHTQTHIIP